MRILSIIIIELCTPVGMSHLAAKTQKQFQVWLSIRDNKRRPVLLTGLKGDLSCKEICHSLVKKQNNINKKGWVGRGKVGLKVSIAV